MDTDYKKQQAAELHCCDCGHIYRSTDEMQPDGEYCSFCAADLDITYEYSKALESIEWSR